MEPNTTPILLGLWLVLAGPVFLATTVFLLIVLRKRSRLSRTKEQALLERVKSLEDQNYVALKDAESSVRNKWLSKVVENTYRNEVEVEVKFVHPLVQFLGYAANEMRVRMPVEVQVGRQRVKAQADWVIFDRSQNKPVLVIEAKEPRQPLDDSVRDQARSYAYGLGVTVYAITNGQRLQIYRRGVVDDHCVMDCNARELASYWPTIEHLMGRKSFQQSAPQQSVVPSQS